MNKLTFQRNCTKMKSYAILQTVIIPLPENVVRCFLVQDGICPEQENESITFRLEENEMEIMRGLIGEGHSLKLYDL